MSSGAHFGVTGRLVGSALTLAFALAYAAIAVWTSGDALVAGAHRLFGTPAGDGALAIGYALIAAEIALVALYGHATVVALQKIVVPVVGVLLLLGIVRLRAATSTRAASASTCSAASGRRGRSRSPSPPPGRCPTRRRSATTRAGSRARTATARVLVAAGLGVFGGLLATTLFGAFTALCLTNLGDSYVGDLVAAAPAWYVLPILRHRARRRRRPGRAEHVRVRAGPGGDHPERAPRAHDADHVARRRSRSSSSARSRSNAVDSITAMTLVLNGVAAPWVVVNLLGFLVARRRTYDPHDLQAFNEGRRGGRYWFTGGWNLRALGAWAAGSAFGLLAVTTDLYTGPLANLAGGVDLVPRRLGARRRRRLPDRAGRLAGRRDRMIDPLTRWAAYGEKPDYAGLMTYAGLPYTEDPAELAGVDVAIVGAPMDELTSDSPGTRFGPRAIRAASLCARRAPGGRRRRAARRAAGGRLRRRPDPPRRPGPLARRRSRPRSRRCWPRARSRSSSAATTRSPSRTSAPSPSVHGPVGLIHFDTHTDTGREVFGATLSHGSCMYRLVESGHIDPERYVQIGLRGYWPGAEEFGWQQERGIVSHFMHDVRDRGIRAVVADAIAHVGAGPVFLSVDIDVLDPAFAPGTGTPEPGGMTSGELLWACREIAQRGRARRRTRSSRCCPDRIGSRDITALVAERVVRETLTGVALRRVRGRVAATRLNRVRLTACAERR